MKKTIPVPVRITKEDDMYVAWCPIFDIASQGKTQKEAIENCKEALDLYSEDKEAKKIKEILFIQMKFNTKSVQDGFKIASPLRN